MKSKYYSGDRILNTKANLLFSFGSRGSGKTYYWKKKLLDNFIDSGRKFIIMRRYKEEIKVLKNTFFDDIPDSGVTVKGYDIFYKNKHCGKYLPLNAYTKYKSVNMSMYDFLMFDEILPEDGRYLNKLSYTYEPKILLNWYQSISRGYDAPIREDVRFICISNTIKTFNPYSSFFKFDKKLVSGATFINQGFVSVEVYENKQVNDVILKTAYGQFIKDTEYGEYALYNKFYQDKNGCIANYPVDKKYKYITLKMNNKYYTFYKQKNSDLLLIKTNENYKHLKVFNIYQGENEPFIIVDDIYKILKKYYNMSRLKAVNQETAEILRILFE